MMHVSLMAGAIAIAILLRLVFTHRCLENAQWLAVLSLLIVSPLLLLTTAVAIVIMGPHGHMVNPMEGWLSYATAWLFLGISCGLLAYLGWQAHISIKAIQQYPQTLVQNTPSRIMSEDSAFSAQIGLWSSELVLSQGLINSLDSDHLAAVIAHEQAHSYYHDTFLFFWLGWLRRLTAWLPYTDDLWQELLLLREIRADHWATRSVDPIMLAESLVQVIAAPLSPITTVNFSCTAPKSRLSRRIDALLDQQHHDYGFQPQWSAMTYGYIARLVFGIFPLCSIPFHY
ncbi:MAG: M56 family metallopeptidase [Leptolyngbyaceae cyanobacterium MAG.088]|nr:M56 family metallopeptidase [Leptolyngbyaceae cyanobacterium MAG.088]